MRYNLWGPPNYDWIFEELAQRSEEERQRFLQLVFKRMLHAESPEEVAQKVLHAQSPEEAAQKLLRASSSAEANRK